MNPLTRSGAPALLIRLALPAVALVAAVALPWLVNAYVISVASIALVMALLALSVQLLGLASQPSLGQAAYLGVGGYVAANTALRWDFPVLSQLAAAIAAAAAAAAVIGILVSRTRGMATMLATLAVAELAAIGAEQWTDVTGGANGLSLPSLQLWPGVHTRQDGIVYLYVLAVCAVAFAAMWQIRRTRLALIWRGITDHEQRMEANGHNVNRNLWLAHIIAAAFAGAAGALLVAVHRYISPGDLGFAVSALALLAAIIGGRTIFGVIAASVLVVAIRDLGGQTLAGQGPLLLGVVFLAAAIWLSRHRNSKTVLR